MFFVCVNAFYLSLDIDYIFAHFFFFHVLGRSGTWNISWFGSI